jgi:hypothetical protein
MVTAQQIPFTVQSNPPTVLTVTTPDGREFELRLANIVVTVIDTGLVNPLDNTPVLSVQAQTAMQISRKTDA